MRFSLNSLSRAKQVRFKKKSKGKRKKYRPTYKYEPVKETQREIADKKVWSTIKTLREQGYSYNNSITKALAKSKFSTRQGGEWSQTAVIKITNRNQ